MSWSLPAGAGGLAVGLAITAVMGRGWYRRDGEQAWIGRGRWLLFAPILALAWAVLAPLGWWAAPAMGFSAFAGAAAVVDLEVHRLPNLLVGASALVVAVTVGAAAVVTGDWGRAATAVFGGAALFVGLLIVSLLGTFGGGDIKLGAVMGAVLGCWSWPAVFAGLVLGLVISGLAGGVWILVRGHGRKAHVPLGPGLVVGTVLAVLASG